jgi:polar amino acid transport system substrate-binding protein
MTGITTAGYGFRQTGIAIAVPKGHPEALAYVTKFIEDAKASGSVRRAMDRAGTGELFMQPVTAVARATKLAITRFR